MLPAAEIVTHLSIKVQGQELPEAIRPQLLEVVVDQHAHLPAMFTIRLQDTNLELLDGDLFTLATVIEIAGFTQNNERISLIKGEITAIEPEFQPGMLTELLVRGYDTSHRLYRVVKSRTFLNVKDSDLAAQMAQAAGLSADVETTNTVYDHLYQHNQSDLQFLRQRAWRIGYECFVDGGKLLFRRPVIQEPKVILAWGDDLMAFQPRLTLAEQVEEVQVRGWDLQQKAPIVGMAKNGRLYPRNESGKTGGELTKNFGANSKHVIVDQPVVSQAEANILAAARLDEISGVFIEAEGRAYRRPEIRAGQSVKVKGAGKRFSGDYFVTAATHLYTHAGFTTNFSAYGTRTGLLIDNMGRDTPLDRWPGVVAALVTNTDDPNGWGRVKVKYPWLTDGEESDWARVIGGGGGPQAGFCTIPAVDDEVLVTFVHGDFAFPVVLGGVWNGQDKLPPPVADAPQGEKPQVRTWFTPKGHQITIYDNRHQLEIKTQSGLRMTFDDEKKRITIEGSHQIEVLAGAKLLLSGEDVEITAKGTIDLRANGKVNVKGSTINLNS